jgi:hypothetical protein
MGWLILCSMRGQHCELMRSGTESPFIVNYQGSQVCSWHLVHISIRRFVWSLGIPISRFANGRLKPQVRLLGRDRRY